ncbi:MAG: tRNA 4-thiouridine(8) synthase ThiI [Actinobacteria bacterium HGW-Actinobacteria-7]|jgi:thiamine biosynthesis protein ThiI|nr:MAG: tRNA 4-thiouridine(8) synthase ThiI [Actinobacteria bacterium HGW-Actinobacteria-7]
MTQRVCLIGYHEIGLKGRNKNGFERRLRDNLDTALVGLPVEKARILASRLEVALTDDTQIEQVGQRISRVPGVATVSLAYKTNRDFEVMEATALRALREAGPWESFAVVTKRSNTDHPETSIEINRRLGAHLLAHAGGKVDLSNPDVRVGVTVAQGYVYTFTRKINGVGGLPVGSAGKIISLLSAGIDSPVASWRMMRRGATIVGVHFSGRPHTGDQSDRLVVEIGEVLRRSGGLGRVYFVAFGELQKEISLLCPPDLRVLMYRRLMIKVAEKIARVERAKALVTGESLGQVASQTLENIAAIDEAAILPVLRPLVGNDKQEIIIEAKTIGTYELSISDHDDCCTLFMPRTPETHARISAVVEAWELLDIDRMVEDALATLSWRDFPGTSYRSPKPWHTPTGESGWSVAQVAAALPPETLGS